jgi:hypothetical protein
VELVQRHDHQSQDIAIAEAVTTLKRLMSEPLS